MTIKQHGYIVTDNEGVVHGTGSTVDAAWKAAERYFAEAHIKLVDDVDDTTYELGSWCRRSSLKTLSATRDLLIAVHDCGGDLPWDTARGIACTPQEAEGDY